MALVATVTDGIDLNRAREAVKAKKSAIAARRRLRSASDTALALGQIDSLPE